MMNYHMPFGTWSRELAAYAARCAEAITGEIDKIDMRSAQRNAFFEYAGAFAHSA
ncbi:MAG: hypothetical protein ACJ8LN_06170 [Sulfurifustis sp.]